MDPVRELKIRADILHSRVAAKEAAAIARLRVLRALKPEDAQKKHCLAVVAREAGFGGWEHALRVLGGDLGEADVGSMLYVGGMLNEWFASYEEARTRLDETTERRFLLGYKRHFIVVPASFVEALGMNPQDPDWAAIGWDWARPKDPTARGRLYFARLVARAKG